ncbi:MAG: T9SS type A sorting domain-containing protein [Ignavibacteriales bacterium]|nr:T9SS type A sorting domain-containing protein [Ignavibacteriales bacterium]
MQRYGTQKPPVIDIYFGGPGLDAIPDYTFTYHDNRVIYLDMFGKNWPIDFNGDGYEEFVFEDAVKNPGSLYANIRYYFCETNTVLTTRNYYVLQLYPDTNYQFAPFNAGFVDMDGDGKHDFTIDMTKKYAPSGSPEKKRWFIYGNNEFNFSNYYEFTDTIEYVDHMYIVQDLNNDGKGELVFANQGTHPYWFTEVMSFGNRPPNITPEYGLNTEWSIWNDGFSPGDVNNDGYNDFIRKIPYSSMFLYLGGSPMWAEKRRAYGTSSSYYNLNFGGRVGDVNGDGIDDFCIAENGYTDHTSIPPGNLYIIAGSDVPNGIKDEGIATTTDGEIKMTVSPNPSSSVTNISYSLPLDGSLVLKMFDITGKEIITEVTEKEKGDHTEIIDFRRLSVASGVYILTLKLKQADKILSKSLKLQYVK